MIDPSELKGKAADKERENRAFFERLKRKKVQGLDQKVQLLHDRVFEDINCLECANCCKSISPVILDADIRRIAPKLKMKPSDFTSKYLRLDKEGDYVFQQTPCPFLHPDNYCAIYDSRPRACREYPHTDRRRFLQITALTLKNTYFCPAVFEIVEYLKKEY
jgi:Fe-S-cluster containining protein